MNQEKSTQLLSPTEHFSVLLSSTPRGARLARLLATEWMRTREVPRGVTEAAEHLVAELATNAATHGRLPGRGLLLVEALADRWGVRLGPVPRKTVWAELDLPNP
ncbi:ATP-binding protein [Streptomyces massasporeus]